MTHVRWLAVLFPLATTLTLNACGTAPETQAAEILSSRSNSAAHFSCVYEDPEESTRFEFTFAENVNEGTLKYRYSPVADPSVVEGSFKLKLVVAGWNMNIYQGNDSQASARLNTPRSPRNGAVRLEMNVLVNGKTLEPRQFLECSQQR
jgi:hypothetical protein